MNITITAFNWVPAGAQGLVRDLRVRWALEEVGVPYDVRYLTLHEAKEPEHRARHPFGQVPTYEENDLVLFESGAIVLHVANRYPGLLPDDANRRARATGWIFSAINTVEVPIWERAMATVLEAGKQWMASRLPIVESRIRERLGELSDWLDDAEWLEGSFSAGDLMMVSVLRHPSGRPFAEAFPNLAAYIARGEARPAFRRALESQMAGFNAEPPPAWRHPSY